MLFLYFVYCLLKLFCHEVCFISILKYSPHIIFTSTKVQVMLITYLSHGYVLMMKVLDDLELVLVKIHQDHVSHSLVVSYV